TRVTCEVVGEGLVSRRQSVSLIKPSLNLAAISLAALRARSHSYLSSPAELWGESAAPFLLQLVGAYLMARTWPVPLDTAVTPVRPETVAALQRQFSVPPSPNSPEPL